VPLGSPAAATPLAALVALAGCGAVGSPTASSDEATATDALPPGTAPDGVTDATAGTAYRRVGGEDAAVRTLSGSPADTLARQGVVDRDAVYLALSSAETTAVERATISYEATLAGESVSVRRTLRYVAVGSATVERPGWVDAATGAETETATG